MIPTLAALSHIMSVATQPPFAVSASAPVAWQQYLSAPYARDTLASLLGPLNVVVQPKNAPPAARPDLTGLTNTAADTITMYGRPNDTYFTHEVGHVLDVRNVAPDVSAQVARLYDPKRPGIGYAATNDFEYTAEAFRNAMELVRKHGSANDFDKHIAREEKRLPGTALWVKWIQQRLTQKAISS